MKLSTQLVLVLLAAAQAVAAALPVAGTDNALVSRSEHGTFSYHQKIYDKANKWDEADANYDKMSTIEKIKHKAKGVKIKHDFKKHHRKIGSQFGLEPRTELVTENVLMPRAKPGTTKYDEDLQHREWNWIQADKNDKKSMSLKQRIKHEAKGVKLKHDFKKHHNKVGAQFGLKERAEPGTGNILIPRARHGTEDYKEELAGRVSNWLKADKNTGAMSSAQRTHHEATGAQVEADVDKHEKAVKDNGGKTTRSNKLKPRAEPGSKEY